MKLRRYTPALSVYQRAVTPGWEKNEVLANFEMCVYDLRTDSITAPCTGTVLRDSAAGAYTRPLFSST
jgi:hypothetical protein